MNSLKSVLLVVALVVFTLGSIEAQASLTMNVEHKTIPINAFYNGNTVVLNGVVDKDEDVVVKLSSSEGKETFMTKGKSAHLFWMNKEKITINGISSVYMLFSSNKVENALSQADRDRYGLGYGAIEKKTVVSPGGDSSKLFGEFIKLKERSKLYETAKENITFKPQADGKNGYSIEVALPYQVQPGQYKVFAYGVKNGTIVDTVSDAISVEPVGVVKGMTVLASKHGAIYGLMSIIIALIAGLMVTPVITLAKIAVVFIITLARRATSTLDEAAESASISISASSSSSFSMASMGVEGEGSESVTEGKVFAEQKNR